MMIQMKKRKRGALSQRKTLRETPTLVLGKLPGSL